MVISVDGAAMALLNPFHAVALRRHAEAERATKVDGTGVDRPHALQPGVIDFHAALAQTLDHIIHAGRFHSITMLVSKACGPEIAFISSYRRPCSVTQT